MNEVIGNSGSGSPDAPEAWPPSLTEVGRLLPQFAILRLLGTGDVGAVYQALSPDGQTVAVKLLPRELSNVPGFAESIANVARQTLRLKHPGIVPVRAFGRTPDGHIFLVSEFVEGEPLSRRLGASRFIAAQAYTLVEQVCDALHHAHGHGVIHGGLHPDNIFLDRSGGVKVLDFGLVPLVALGVAQNESASHAAPEQMAGSAIDHRADVYSAGVILYEMLAGALPHETSLPASQVAHVNPRIDAVIAKAMKFSPDQRYHHAAEMMRAIIAVGMLDGVQPAVLPPAVQRAAPVAPGVVVVPPAAGKRTAELGKWGAIAAGVLVLAASGYFILRPGAKSPPPRPLVRVVEFPTAVVEKPAEPPRAQPSESRPVAAPPKPPEPKIARNPAPGIAPGEWQPVPLDGRIGGATPLDGGGIRLTKGSRLDQFRGKDVAIRGVLRLVEEPKIVQLWLRAGPVSRAQITLNWKPALTIQTTLGENKFKPFGETTAPWAVLEDRWVTIEFAAIGDQLIGFVNDRAIEVTMPSDVLEEGSIGLFSPDGEIRSLEFAPLDGVPREKYPDFVKKALNAADALLAKAAVEAKPMTPPVPEKPKGSPEVEQWLAKVDGPFQEAYAREVAKPFDTAAAELRRGYTQAIERQSAAAQGAGKLEDVNVWRKEREVFFGNGQNLPADDSDNPLAAIKTLRAGFRATFVRHDRERFERARAHFAKYDAVLSQNLAALNQRQRVDDAALLTTRRDQLTKEWLVPPMVLAPIASGPPLGAKPVAAEAPKYSLKETIDWLLQNEAELEIYEANKWTRVTDARLVPNARVGFGLRIDGTKVKTPLTADDLRRLASLRTITRLELPNAFPEAAFEFLREIEGVNRLQLPGDKLTDAFVETLGALADLKSFQLRNGATFTGKTLDQLAKLTALHGIDLEGSGLNDEGAAALAKIESIDELNVRRTRITDAGLVQIAKLRLLKRLEIDRCAGITAAGLATLKTLRNLELVDYLHDGLKDYTAAARALAANCNRVPFTRLRGRGITAEHIAPLTEWRSLTHLAMPDAGFAGDGTAALATLTRLDHLEVTGSVFTDADVEHLLGLKELRKLNLSGTQITDAGLLKLKAMKGLKELTVSNTPTTPAGVRQMEREHPGCRVIRAAR